MSRAGYTVIEILVATASALATLAVLGTTTRLQGRLIGRESKALDLREISRRVVEQVAREIRGAGFDPLAQGPFDGPADGISVAAADAIELRSDLQGAASGDPSDGAIDLNSDELISFYRSASRQAVYQSVGQQILPLMSGIVVPQQGFHLRYFDACDQEILPQASGELSDLDRTRVRRVSVFLAVSDATGGSAVATETAVVLRNRSLRCESQP